MYYRGQIGKTIRELRTSSGVSMRAFNDFNISAIEHGRSEPTLASCEIASYRLNVQLGQLVSTAQHPRPMFVLDPFTEHVAGYLKHLSQRNRVILLEVLKDLS